MYSQGRPICSGLLVSSKTSFFEIPHLVYRVLANNLKPLPGGLFSLSQLASAGYVRKCCNCAIFWMYDHMSL